MVFESLVVDLLNRFIGDYVENLDRSQLKIGIWGGDVVLRNLEVKQSALDDLDLPVKIVSGHLGNLTLKIPWKNLYSAPVVASIDGLYIVVIPNSGIKYDEDKENKAKQESKQKELQRIEEAKEREAQKDKPQDKKKDSFGEKMAMQVVKNLQVKVKNIHVRFEDTFTNEARPFGFGVTLSELAFETTDENWKPSVLGESVKMIYKLITLDSLSAYWNSDIKCLSKLPREECQKALISGIASKEFIPNDVSYLLGPINSTAQLKLNPKPENDGSNYSIPKILLNVIMQELAIGISKYQYQDILELLQSFERMNSASRYRKYHPYLPRKGHSKEWWKFGLDCILGEDIRRRKKNWSWAHMKSHRDLCRKYKAAYKIKLSQKKVPKAEQATIEECEKVLDVFNLTVQRKQAEVEVEREGLKAKEEKANRGWFGGMFGGGNKSKSKAGSGPDIAQQFEEAMTAEEKAKLYSAIDYQENSAPTVYPKEFVENQLTFMLNNLSISVKDDSQKEPMVMKLQLKDVYSCIRQRPSDDAICIEAKMDNMEMQGRPTSDGDNPLMITSLKLASDITSLLNIHVETNPLDRSCDQRVHVTANPLQIVYDADTINHLVEVFKPPESIALTQLQAAAMNKFEDIKNMSATGLQYAIEQHKYLDLKVDLKSSFVIVPEFGAFKRNGHLLVLDLGDVGILSIKRSAEKSNVNQLMRSGSTEVEVFETLKSQAYDKFKLNISNVQILLSAPGEDWKMSRTKSDSDMHVLKPTDLMLELNKCIIPDNPDLPKMKIIGNLPNININISDEKLMQLAQLGLSIPTPQPSSPTPADTLPTATVEASVTRLAENVKIASDVGKTGKDSQKTEEIAQMTDLELEFEIKEICLQVSTRKDDGSAPLIGFSINNLGTKVKMQTFEMNVDLYLGSISLEHMQFSDHDGKPLHLISTGAAGSSQLFSLNFIQVNKDNPDLKQKYDSTLQHLTVNFNELDVVLHQDAILSTMKFANELVERLQSLQDQKDVIEIEPITPVAEEIKTIGTIAKVSKKKEEDELIELKIMANLNVIHVTICSIEKVISEMKVGGVKASVVLTKSMTKVNAGLEQLVVEDPTPNALYPQILSGSEGQVVDASIVLYNNATDDENYGNMNAVDMSVSVVLGCLQVVFVNKFVANVLSFLDNFQAAKDKVTAASKAAAEAAKQSVESAYDKASRLLLDITLQAPIIYIPQSSTSLNALVAHLGVLTLNNKFEMVNKRNELGIPAILDKMSLKLENLKLTRTILEADTKKIYTECLLLDPLTISISVTRNMSVSWFKDLPEVDVAATLSPVLLCLSQEDFTMIMKVLNENLTEGQPPDSSNVDQLNKTSVSEEKTKKVSVKEQSETVSVPKASIEKVYKRVKLSFRIDRIGITLYIGSSNLSSGVIERDAKNSLASFQLHMLVLKGEVMSNNSLWINIILMNVIMDDLRAKRKQGITRYMENKGYGVNNTGKSMVDITFSQDESEDKFLDMKVSSFTLIVCLDHLMAIADFFTKGMPATESSKAISKPGAEVTPAPAKAAPVQPTSNTTINFKIEKPDIILVENVEDIDTNAIMLNTEILMKLRITPDTQNMNAHVKDLQMLLCCFNPIKRGDSVYEILSPLSISLNMNVPFGKGQHIDLSFTDVFLHVSPGTIAVLTAISSSISPQSTEEQTESPQKEIDFTNIWNCKLVTDCHFWFLKSEIGEEADVVNEVSPAHQPTEMTEDNDDQLIITMETIILTVEANVGSRTIPMILLEANLHAEARNWTSNLYVSSTLALEIGYYNEKIAIWEPLIEPSQQNNERKPWEICLEVIKNEEIPATTPDDSEEVDISLPSSAMCVNVFSHDVLEITVSKICLTVLTNLGNAFGEAVKTATTVKKDKLVAPYVVKNDTGISLILCLDEKFKVMKEQTNDIKEVVLEPNTTVPLTVVEDKLATFTSVLRNQQVEDDKILLVKVVHNDIEAVRQITLTRADSQFFLLPHTSSSGDKWGLVADINVSEGSKTITFRSHVQVQNHFSVPIEIYYMMSAGNEVQCCGIIEPNSVFNIPIHALYTTSSELFFRPKDDYSVALEAFVWKDLIHETKKHKVLHCNSRTPGGQPFFMNVSGDVSQISFENTSKKTLGSTCYKLNLRPTTMLRNLLPYELHYTLEGTADEVTLKEGNSAELLTVEVNKTGADMRINGYLEKEWWCRKTFDGCADELSVWTFESFDDQKHSIDLGAHTVNVNGSLTISLYCPFWMINKTSQLLTYKQGDDSSNFIYHSPEITSPILFSFKPKNFFAKKKACLKVHDSEWSDKFSVDVVGSSGKISAKTKDGTVYEVGVQIRLSNSGLTKIVIFTPLYMIANNAPYDIECLENIAGCEWISVTSKSCTPFWPKGNGKITEMVSRVAGTLEQSPVFNYTDVNTTLLPLDNKFCGLNVECQITESQILLSYSEYHPGDATVQLINACSECTMEYNQKGDSDVKKLESNQTILYTWKNPLGKRELIWKCEGIKKENTNALIKDGIGEFKTTAGTTVYWVSFLDGLQRVLMLTSDLSVATTAQQAGELETADLELNLSLNGVGLSLVNNDTRKEVLYIGIASSGVIWEGRKMKSSRFKALTQKENNTLEQAHIKYLNDVQLGKSPKPRQHLEHKIEVDFAEMLMYKPHKRHVQRSFQNGIWIQYKLSTHRVQLHAKINRIQVDNQLPDSVFPIVLAPLPPPKSVAADSVPKPFTELSLVMRKAEHSSVQQFKYFKVLIQEFHVKMDQGLINALLELFSPDEPVEVDHEALYKADMDIVETDLKTLAAIQSSHGQRNFYDELHLSPLKIHVSFSVTGGSSNNSNSASTPQSNFVNLLLKSVGVTVTEIQDVVFKLAFFERNYKFMTQQKLMSEVIMHYTGQAIKQMYVLVLGLDVIGNPFGLVLGITQGVEDLFYEPFQGAIQGPEEFAEGLALGVRSLFGHALGGAAGAASRITGTLGKGIAALTMDDDYQKKRREAMNRKPTNVRTGLAQSGKGLVMGVFDGVTGIVTKPIEGAKEEGIEGFFKGVGKGLIGVVARPTSGAIDFASGSLEAIKKVTEVGDETKKLRPPRFIQSDGIIRPYVRSEAEGYKLLLEVEKGKFVNTDCYIAHLLLTPDGKFILLVTDKRTILLNKGEIFGQWDSEWSYSWEELKEPPTLTEKGFRLLLKKEQKKKKLGIFGGADNGKAVNIKDPKSAAWIVGKMTEAMKKAVQ